MSVRDPQQARRRGTEGPKGEFIGAAEAAELLGVTSATVRRWIKEGRLQARKVGKHWRIERAGLGRVISLRQAADEGPDQSVGEDSLREARKAVNSLFHTVGTETGAARGLVEGIEAQVALSPGSMQELRSLLAELLAAAIHGRASDLHLEPWGDCLKVRQRTDGMLLEAPQLPKELSRPLVEEAMRWARLDPHMRHLPQDGRFSLELNGRQVDIRVSTMPMVHGSVATLRILDRQVQLPPIDRLGLEPDQLERFRDAVHRPSGLIVVTGPAGCGRTTTLYAALRELNAPTRKIMTAESPVECSIHGLDQAEIRPDVGFDFVQATRAMLRQDADVIFVGEIANAEVGEMACKAGATGHLAFSAMYATDAPGVPTWLVEMGVEPFLVASSLQCVVAQRLARLICPDCKAEHSPSTENLDALGLAGSARERTFYRGDGCEKCHGTGYRGRTAVFQLMDVNGEVREAIAGGATRAEIREAARLAGCCRPFREVALDKICRGDTTVEEVVRIFAPDQ